MGSGPYSDLWLDVPEPDVEVAAELLCALGSQGAVETPLADGRVRVLGSVPLDQREDAWARLQQDVASAVDDGRLGLAPDLGSGLSPEVDWQAVLRHHHRPFRVGGVLVRPPWVEPTGEQEVVLEPGMAFGTGGHETTRLCLDALAVEVLDRSPGRLLDVGTGSGILALVALRLAADLQAVACDVDPDAVDSARKAAADNGLSERLRLHLGPVDASWGGFPLVVANLQWNVFQPQLGDIAARVESGGVLLCSGLLLDQAGPMAELASRFGLALRSQNSDGEWCLLRFQKA